MAVKSDDVWEMERREFLQGLPPRHVPPSVKRQIPGFHRVVLMVGLAFIGLGSLVGLLSFPVGFVDQWRLDRGSAEWVEGRILGVERTWMLDNRTRIFRYRFRYDGGPVRMAYTTGGPVWRAGDPVKVKRLTEDPRIAVPECCRIAAQPASNLIFWVAPFLGGLVLSLEALRVWNRRRLFRNGVLGSAMVESITDPFGGYRYFLKARLIRREDGAVITVWIDSPAKAALLWKKLAEKESVAILADPKKPSRLTFPEAWQR